MCSIRRGISGIGIESRKVEDAKFLLHSSSCNEGVMCRWECDSSDSMVMLQSAKSFAAVGVPYSSKDLLALVIQQKFEDLRSKVGRGACSDVGICRKSGLVNGTLVSKEGANPTEHKQRAVHQKAHQKAKSKEEQGIPITSNAISKHRLVVCALVSLCPSSPFPFSAFGKYLCKQRSDNRCHHHQPSRKN